MAIKILMPGDGAINPYTIPGTIRTYTCAVGSKVTVPDFDAVLMLNSGWVNSIGWHGGAGTTTQRPTAPKWNEMYNDTTAGYIVTWAGPKTGWINSLTGAAG